MNVATVLWSLFPAMAWVFLMCLRATIIARAKSRSSKQAIGMYMAVKLALMLDVAHIWRSLGMASLVYVKEKSKFIARTVHMAAISIAKQTSVKARIFLDLRYRAYIRSCMITGNRKWRYEHLYSGTEEMAYFVWPILIQTAHKLGTEIKYDLANVISWERMSPESYIHLMQSIQYSVNESDR